MRRGLSLGQVQTLDLEIQSKNLARDIENIFNEI